MLCVAEPENRAKLRDGAIRAHFVVCSQLASRLPLHATFDNFLPTRFRLPFRDRRVFIGDVELMELDPRALRRRQPQSGPTLGPAGTAGGVHFPPPPENVPRSTARDGFASLDALAAPPPLHTAVLVQPNMQIGATGYPPDAPPPPPRITLLSMLRVQPLFARTLELPGRKRASIEFAAAT